MSLTSLAWVVDWTADLSATQKMVMLALANYTSDDDETCYPSVRIIAEIAGLSDRSVRMTLARLEELGYLTIERRMDDEGRKTSNVYTLHRDRGVLRESRRRGGAGIAGAPERRAGTPERGAGRAPERRAGHEPQEDEPQDEPPALVAPPKPRRKMPGRPLSPDFTVTPAMYAYAKANAPSVDPEAELRAMRNWAESKDERKADWVATWRGFCDRDHARNVEKGWKPPKPMLTKADLDEVPDDGLRPVLAW